MYYWLYVLYHQLALDTLRDRAFGGGEGSAYEYHHINEYGGADEEDAPHLYTSNATSTRFSG